MNNIKKVFFILFLLGYAGIVWAQSIVVSGQLKDAKTNEKIAYCNFVVYPSDDTTKKISGISNDKGFFEVELDHGGMYNIDFFRIGYKKTSHKFYSRSNIFLGTIKMMPGTTYLNEVVVKGEKTSYQVDKTTVVITKEMRQNISDAPELLEKIPELTYDRLNNKVKIDNQDVVILVDGVEKNNNFLKNIPVKKLQKVEIIRNPSGKYAIEGNNAIINIVLNKNYRGVDVSTEVAPFLKYDDDIYLPLFTQQAYVGVSGKKVNLYFNEYFKRQRIKTLSSVAMNLNDTINIVSPENDFYFEDNNITVDLSCDYTPNPRNYFSLEFSSTVYPQETSQEIRKSYVVTTPSDTTVYNTAEYSENKIEKSVISLFHRYKINFNKGITSYIRFVKQDISKIYDNKTDYLLKILQNKVDANSELNYVLFGKTFISGGVGFVTGTTYTKSAFGTEQQENKYRSYLYVKNKLNRFLSLQCGVNYEKYFLEINDDKYNFDLIKPDISLMLKFGKAFLLNPSYTREIAYPGTGILLPVSIQTSYFVVTQGNPKLEPAIADVYKTKLSFFSGILSLEPYYKHYKNAIGYDVVVSNSLLIYIPNNKFSYSRSGIKINMTLPVKNRFFVKTFADFYKEYTTEKEVSGNNVNISIGYRGLKNDVLAMLEYKKNISKHLTYLGYNRTSNNDIDYYMLMVRKMFKKRVALSLGYILPVEWGIADKMEKFEERENYKSNYLLYSTTFKNMFFVKLSYKFSNGKIYDKEVKEYKDEHEIKEEDLKFNL